MKKYGVLLAFLLVPILGCITYATKDDFGTLDSVVSVQQKKDVIYDRTMKWIATKYVSPKTVMQYCDKPTGIITFLGAFTYPSLMYSYNMEYKVLINIKDNKFKMELTPIQWIYSAKGQVGNWYSPDMAKAHSTEYEKIKKDLSGFIDGKEAEF